MILRSKSTKMSFNERINLYHAKVTWDTKALLRVMPINCSQHMNTKNLIENKSHICEQLNVSNKKTLLKMDFEGKNLKILLLLSITSIIVWITIYMYYWMSDYGKRNFIVPFNPN